MAGWQVKAAAELLDSDATIPFIAPLSKRSHRLPGRSRHHPRFGIGFKRLRELDQRRESILKSLEERELLTDELKERILAAETLATLEDIYLPFRPKRRDTGHHRQGKRPGTPGRGHLPNRMKPWIRLPRPKAMWMREKGVATVEEALAGARDIIAEWVR